MACQLWGSLLLHNMSLYQMTSADMIPDLSGCYSCPLHRQYQLQQSRQIVRVVQLNLVYRFPFSSEDAPLSDRFAASGFIPHFMPTIKVRATGLIDFPCPL